MKLIKKLGVGLAVTLPLAALASGPDATTVATQANTAFGVIAPVTIGIIAFYVILRLAKRTVK